MIKYGRVRPRLEIVKIKEQFTRGLSTQLTHTHNDAATDVEWTMYQVSVRANLHTCQ